MRPRGNTPGGPIRIQTTWAPRCGQVPLEIVTSATSEVPFYLRPLRREMEPTLTPKLATYVVVKDARGLIRFVEQAIGGKLSFESSDADGRLAHAEVRIADGLLMVGEQPSGRDPFRAMLHLYVTDTDAAYGRAIAAGAASVREPGESGDGLRRGGVRDTWGNEWRFSSPVAPV